MRGYTEYQDKTTDEPHFLGSFPIYLDFGQKVSIIGYDNALNIYKNDDFENHLKGVNYP